MEKTNGTMSKIAAWGDLKVAGLLRDLKSKEEPAQDPAPCRAVCRVVLLLILLIALSVSLVFLFWEAPDVRIKQISNLQGKHKDYPVGKLFNKTNGQTFESISCPCTKTSISIADILKFTVLYEDSLEWSIGYNAGAQPPSITVPDFNTSGNQLAGHVQEDPVPLTADMFCNSTNLWPPLNAPSNAELSLDQRSFMCHLAATVIPNRTSSTEGSFPMETPNLLNAEALAASIFQGVQEKLVKIQSMIAMDLANPTATMYGNALMSFLRDVPPIDYGVGTDPWPSYYYGALDQGARMNTLVNFNITNATVLVFNTSQGIGFLRMSANWTAHYNSCKPEYCEETMQMGFVRKLYWALGLLGGTVTIVLGFVNIVLWPSTVFVLSWLYTKHQG